MNETTRKSPGRRTASAVKPVSGGARSRRSAPSVEMVPEKVETGPARKKTATRDNTGRKPRSMSAEHKSAIQSGRAQTRIVREYLEALESRRPRRGPRPDPAKMQSRIEIIDAALGTAEPLERVTLHQERMDLEHQIEALEQGDRFALLEEGFVSVAGEYSKRRGISGEAWLAVGVPKGVVKRAGIA